MRRGRDWLTVAALVAVAAGLIAWPGSGGAAGAEATASKVKRVNIKGFAYRPKTLTVKRGDKVRFRNLDRSRHDAVDRGAFATGTLRKGKAKTIRFKKRGTFRYLCTFHPFMKGKVVVK